MSALVAFLILGAANAAGLSAGVAKVDITDTDAGPVNDPLFAKALVLKDESATLAIVTIDAVALAEIGSIPNDFLTRLRSRIETELGIPPAHVLVNASHCHGAVCADVDERAFQAVKTALQNTVPVDVGAGTGREDRIMENRRLRLKDGSEADVRHAYSLPPTGDIVGTGPVDPEIGVLRIDRKDGRTLAVVYNFACHPIQGVPSRGNTADLVGFASKVIENGTGEDTMALFLQGCAGDINPIGYKAVDCPRDAEPLGNKLGMSALQALHGIQTRPDAPLRIVSDTLALPRADWTSRIAAMEAEQAALLRSLKGTSLNLETFVPLAVKYGLSEQSPPFRSYEHSHDPSLDRDAWDKFDAENRRNIDDYAANVHTMERLTRLQTNLDLLRKHQAANAAAGKDTIDVEVLGLRIGDFRLVTFPGEPSVQVGLNIKAASPHDLTFVAAYTNGYIYYAPTEEQLRNPGYAQEDCECVLGPGWQALYEAKALQLLKGL